MKISWIDKRLSIIMSNLLAFFLVFILLFKPQFASADSTTDAIDVLTNMTCETQGMGQIFTTEGSQSCTPQAISSILIAQIVSPQIYSALMLRLKIGFEGLDYTKNNCLRTNRANNLNPTISFGLCSNVSLFLYRMELVAQLFTFNNTSSVAEALAGISPNYSRYHDSFINKKVGDNGIFVDLPGGPSSVTPVIPWYVTRNNDRICVSTYTIFGGLLEVGCKYIEEPFPNGLYKQFFNTGLGVDSSSKNITSSQLPADAKQFFACASSGGCAQRATENSQAMMSVTSVIIECIRSTLLSTLISNTTCGIDSGQIIYGSNMFHQFQKNMQRAVMAFLTIYVIFIGFKLVLAEGQIPPAGEFIMYALKVILVIYFSVGININNGGTVDGMTQWVFPLLLNMANQMASWIGSATPSGLCVFDPSTYAPGMSRLVLWDTLDCKVMNYLGFDTLSSLFLGSSSGDNLGNSVPPYFFLLIPALISGQINLVMLALSYPLVVMSVAAYLVTTFAICLIAITVLAVLAPIYVPMVLFEQTKGYFDSWWRLMFSFTLQPVVIVAFMTVMFAVFDKGFYNDCEYVNIAVQQQKNGVMTTKRLYVIQTDKTKYSDYAAPNSAKYNNCSQSLGWIFNQPLALIANAAVKSTLSGPAGAGLVAGAQVIRVSPDPMNPSDYQSQFPVLSGIKQVSGVFFTYTSLIGNINKQMIINLFASILLLYLMRELSGQMSEFAADLSGGVSLSGVTISPRSINGNTIKEKLEDYKDNKKHQEMDRREEAIKSREDDLEKRKGTSSGDPLSKRSGSDSDKKGNDPESLKKGREQASSGEPKIASNNSNESDA